MQNKQDPPNTEIFYPHCDGKPIAESDVTRNYLFYCVEALDIYFQNRKDVYVSANLFIYYEEGIPSKVVTPDVFVVFEVPKKSRYNYKVWEENNKAPSFVIEITSELTQEEDQIDKPIQYASLGVIEYFLYDPHKDYLNPNLKGFRLNLFNTSEPIQQDILSDGTFSIHSDVLNLDLRLINDELRFFDPQTGSKLLSYEESYEARIIAEQELEAAKVRFEAEQIKLEAAKVRFEAEQIKLEAEKVLYTTVSKLLAIGLSVEQIASGLSLSVEKVRRLIKE